MILFFQFELYPSITNFLLQSILELEITSKNSLPRECLSLSG
jgi:hypothetical protein